MKERRLSLTCLVAAILLAGCATGRPGLLADSQAALDIGQQPLFGEWVPLPCDANSTAGLSGGADLGGPFGGTIAEMGNAISAFVGEPIEFDGTAEAPAWSYPSGSASLVDLQLRFFWPGEWPSADLELAQAILTASLANFDKSLAWEVDGSEFQNEDGTRGLHVDARGTDGARNVQAMLRVDGATGLILLPTLDEPPTIDPYDERHHKAAGAYMDCLRAAGEPVPFEPRSSGAAFPLLGTWTIRFTASQTVQVGMCLGSPAAIYVDAGTGAIVKVVAAACA